MRPLLIVAGDGSLKPERRHNVGSHVDVLPTVARLLGILPEAVPWLGRSLFDDRGPHVAYYNTPWGDGRIGLWTDDLKTVREVATGAYRHHDVRGWHEEPSAGPPERLRRAERMLRAYHALSQHVLKMYMAQ